MTAHFRFFDDSQSSNSRSFERFPAVPCVSNYRTSTVITPFFDTVMHYISIIVIKVKAELQLFSIILKNVIKLQLITILITDLFDYKGTLGFLVYRE